ncbi:MAG: molybdopterin-binding protein [Nitrospirota bacterium]
MIPQKTDKEILEPFLELCAKGNKETEEVSITNAIGRVVLSDIDAVIDDPPYSKSTANGFLLLASGTALASPKRPMTFELLGDIPDPSKAIELPPGKAVRVKNGSYMAIKRFLESHFAVVKESDAQESKNIVSVSHLIERHENIMLQGSVRKVGNTLFAREYQLKFRDIFTLARQGIQKIKVVKVVNRPNVGIFSTGKEILPFGVPYKIGCKYDCNGAGLAGMITAAGGVPIPLGIVPDDTALFVKKMAEAYAQCDMIIFSGAARMGSGVFRLNAIKAAYQTISPEAPLEYIHKMVVPEPDIAPTLLAMVSKKPVIGLSGEQDSLIDGFKRFAIPLISHLTG